MKQLLTFWEYMNLKLFLFPDLAVIILLMIVGDMDFKLLPEYMKPLKTPGRSLRSDETEP